MRARVIWDVLAIALDHSLQSPTGFELTRGARILQSASGKRVGDTSSKAVHNAASESDSAQLNAWMDRYACGEDSVFPLIHREIAPRLLRFLTRLSGSTTLADDLTQETFLRIHRARGSFMKGAAALPWAYTIARNAFLDRSRRKGNRPTSELQPDAQSSEEPSAERNVAARQGMDRVRQVLAALPVAQREAFILLRFEETSVRDAAEILGVTEAAVKVRAFRAYEALREALTTDEG